MILYKLWERQDLCCSSFLQIIKEKEEVMSKKTHMNIGGMTCIHCQNTIEKALKNTKGVIKASVSYKRGIADIEYDDSVTNVNKLAKVIENEDYKVISSEGKTSPGITETLGILVIIAALYYLLQTFGLLNHLVPDRLADSEMGYGMLFAIGLITSVHCIAMCGGIGLSQSLPNGKEAKAILPAALYNLGRVCSYTAIGFVLGLIGSFIGGGSGIGVPVMLQGILKIVAGLVMVLMGINMLGIFPVLRRFSIHMPAGVAKLIGEKSRAAKTPFIVGLLNGFMPCGPLQTMWIVAFASASPVSGALSMLMFSLGTVPLMLGLGSVVSLLGKKFTKQVMRVGAILVVVLGLATFTQGTALSGLMSMVQMYTGGSADVAAAEGEDSEEAPEDIAEENGNVTDGVQEIRSTLTRGSYPEITVQAGIPVRWIIDAPAENINGCNSMMIIPNYGIQHAFEPGENIIEFTPTESGSFSYSCWMGMVYGSINVVE